jgi:hypothetical protein
MRSDISIWWSVKKNKWNMFAKQILKAQMMHLSLTNIGQAKHDLKTLHRLSPKLTGWAP